MTNLGAKDPGINTAAVESSLISYKDLDRIWSQLQPLERDVGTLDRGLYKLPAPPDVNLFRDPSSQAPNPVRHCGRKLRCANHGA